MTNYNWSNIVIWIHYILILCNNHDKLPHEYGQKKNDVTKLIWKGSVGTSNKKGKEKGVLDNWWDRWALHVRRSREKDDEKAKSWKSVAYTRGDETQVHNSRSRLA